MCQYLALFGKHCINFHFSVSVLQGDSFIWKKCVLEMGRPGLIRDDFGTLDDVGNAFCKAGILAVF